MRFFVLFANAVKHRVHHLLLMAREFAPLEIGARHFRPTAERDIERAKAEKRLAELNRQNEKKEEESA